MFHKQMGDEIIIHFSFCVIHVGGEQHTHAPGIAPNYVTFKVRIS